MKPLVLPMILAAALAVSGCHKKEASPPATATNTTVTLKGASPAGAPTEAPAAAFDKSKVPVSNVKLGAFPYLSLPTGYTAGGAETLDVARFPFWVGDHFEWVEGKAYQARINTAENKTFSKYEVQKNIESLIAQAGGVKISDAKIPREATDKLTSDTTQQFNTGLGDIYNDNTEVFLVHQADKDIWIHFAANSAGGAWTIVEAKPFTPTAKLLPSSVLKDEIDKTGKAAIQVNFAVDKADILPSSQPQIAEVVKLMGEPGLKLAVDGHTDNSGTPAHNQVLSQARAKSVVAALVGAGIGADRLTAHGYGSDRPIASNDTEDGRAKNRRVELVKV